MQHEDIIMWAIFGFVVFLLLVLLGVIMWESKRDRKRIEEKIKEGRKP